LSDVQRAVALALNAQAVGDDLLWVFRVLEDVLIGDRGHGLAG
jgi:hypothetical protein